ncbi:MAG: ImmA/IrrE family metallo-endopeptidase [Actinomycetota bacterium]|jgi:Zn-dependent peptidase ImmA (M78 family)/predicted secreted protein|nr:ImmA/IrrE family metallo-endopeptidase [Actinomycetota bacterium]
MANLRDVRRDAVFKAETLLADLDIGAAERVRIFDVIEDQSVWLTFEPLDRLFGWYQRVDQAAGMVINASHPAALQRFTAAHELGHHLLGHGASLDDEHAIIDGGQGNDPQEVAAHTFAANLLMPLAAVEHHLRRLGLDPARPDITPVAAYHLSVELGVSYAATVVQLASLNKIAWQELPSLRRARPLALKEQLVGQGPQYSRAAVWPLAATDNGRHLLVDTGDELYLHLEEIRSSGYRWMPADATLEGFSLLDDRLEGATEIDPRYGDARTRRLVFKAVNPGPRLVIVDLRHPWEPDGEPLERFALAIDIEGPRISPVGRGVSVNQQPQLVAA